MADEPVSEEVTVADDKPTNTAEYGCITDLKKQQAETAEQPKSAAKFSTTSNKD